MIKPEQFKKWNKIVLLQIIILILISSIAYAQYVGCCTNPASALVCDDDRIAHRDADCCPSINEYPTYYKSEENPNGPQDYNDCINNFFYPGQLCENTDECVIGCCCEIPTPYVKSKAECSVNLDFFEGKTDCTKSDACGIPPQCSDGIDNDGDGCTDWIGGDGDCLNADDDYEGGSDCHTGADCNSVSYVSELSNLIASPVKGHRKIDLSWSDECSGNALKYEISRCKGSDCTDFTLIGISTKQSFTDDSDLLFDQDYNYNIKAYYSTMTATPSAEIVSNPGNLECWHKTDNDVFCIFSSYYNAYKEYLVNNLNFPSGSGNFNRRVNSRFGEKLNTPYSCGDSNNLVESGERCGDGMVCIIKDDEAKCIAFPECNYEEANPFGLYYGEKECEEEEYCFYDRSFTIADSCFSCDPEMSCYDYKSRQSCEKDRCSLKRCEWHDLSAELGTGVCIDNNTDNCRWCRETGTGETENTEVTSKVFEGCTEQKAEKLSLEDYKCYYRDGIAKSCSDVVCTDYSTDECSTGTGLDSFNKITNPSDDACSIKVCQAFDGVCRKNADGNNSPDCSETDENCEKDYFKPDTIITPLVNAGVYESLIIQIFDKVSSESPESLITENTYKTYLCKGSSCSHPYDIVTNAKNLEILGLNVYDSLTYERLFVLEEGSNNIKYYSEDPSKNVGYVKEIKVNAVDDPNPRPRVPSINITPGKKVGEIYYTNSLTPIITARFYQDVYITHAVLRNTANGQIIVPQYYDGLSDNFEFSFSSEQVQGTYVFELDAKNPGDIYLGNTELITLVIDTSAITVEIVPEPGTEITASSNVPISLTFNKPVNSPNVFINEEDFSESFQSQDNTVYTATLKLDDGNKVMKIRATDYASNNFSNSTTFIVNAKPVSIWIKEPSYGVASQYTFDLIVETDNDVECRYSFEEQTLDVLDYNFMDEFDSTGGTEHKIYNFNEIPDGSTRQYLLYVMCEDPVHGFGSDILELRVDTTPPIIQTALAHPNPVIEIPPETKLRLNTNEDTICKYSKEQSEYDLMNGTFQGFEEGDFRTVHNHNVSNLPQSGILKYFAGCENKAGLESEAKEISFEIDPTLPLVVTDHTPEFSDTTAIELIIETNKKVQCRYSQKNSMLTSGILFGPAAYVHKKTIILDPGTYNYYVICKDHYLSQWSQAITVSFTLDTSIPSMEYVDDSSSLSNPEISWMTDRLRVKWLGADEDSEISHYIYSLEEFGTLQPIINWTSYSDGGDWIWISLDGNNSLIDGVEYYFRVKAKNIVDLESEIMESDGVTIDVSSKPADCTNKILDPSESDIDCGGSCEPCENNKKCSENIDCRSGYCEDGICSGVSCSDNAAQASNGETDIDCGGNNCGKCGEGKKCNEDSDCLSNTCEFGRCKSTTCNDGLLSPTESDIDCGGACPTRCEEGKYCNFETDCAESLTCFNDKCTFCEDENCGVESDDKDEYDKDGDGLDDEWELRHGLDPNDASDALGDFDGDGLTNKEEYRLGTDPTNQDTDGDGHDDKKEVDRGTDPLDSKSKPGSKIFMIALMIILGGIVGAGVFVGYHYYIGSQPTKMQNERTGSGSAPGAGTASKKTGQASEQIRQTRMKEVQNKRVSEQKKKRSKVFEAFDDAEKPAKETKKTGQKPATGVKRPATKRYDKQAASKQKQDSFSRLSEMAKKKPKHASEDPDKEDTFVKLKKVAKKKKK